MKLLLLQHPDETSQAKNTARLVALCCPQSQIITGLHPEDFAEVSSLLSPATSAVIYPSPSSLPLEHHSESLPQGALSNLIFLDASWRKSRALWHNNPWLSELPQWHFATPPPSRYRIRHTNNSNSLSTLEAVAYTLETGYHRSAQGLLIALEAMQTHWRGPRSHWR